MTDFTLDELLEFTHMEEQMINEMFSKNTEDPCEPSNDTVNTLLAYSKALSIRKSRSMQHIRVVLN
jgi:hypothetical protein